MPKRPDGLLRAFSMSALQINDDLSRLEGELRISLGHIPEKASARKISEYEQFESRLRVEAAQMSEMYEIFYCLENSMRDLASEILKEAEGYDWWHSKRVDEVRIGKPSEQRREKEVDSAVAPRSDNLIDYTTFGELSQLITDNWDIFEPVFSSKKAVSNITNQLNLLRGPIAHCNKTEDLERERLNLAVRSWFRLMS